MDCTPFFVATGDDNGVVAVWNAFSGQLKYLIEVPFSHLPDGKPNNKSTGSPFNKNALNSSNDDSNESDTASNMGGET